MTTWTIYFLLFQIKINLRFLNFSTIGKEKDVLIDYAGRANNFILAFVGCVALTLIGNIWKKDVIGRWTNTKSVYLWTNVNQNQM